MKILFIYKTLVLDRDGASDQIRRLAGELLKQGHQVAAVGLNDTFSTEPFDGVQDADGFSLPVLRVPASWSAGQRFGTAAKWIQKFNPDWVSLHFVNFAFNRYGLPLDVLLKFRRTIGPAKLHIQLWELWCGMSATARWKERVLGATQKVFLKLMLAKLKPEKITTSTKEYQSSLKEIGTDATLIKVFGNIGLEDDGNDAEWENIVASANLSSLIESPQDWLILGFFGTVYHYYDVKTVLNDAAEAAKKMGRKLGILVVGHVRKSIPDAAEISEITKAIPNAAYWQTGPLSPALINRSMRLVDLGVITTTSSALDKSSTAVAWLERNIPILISPEDKSYTESEFKSQGIFQVNGSADISAAFHVKGKLSSVSRLEKVASIYTSFAAGNSNLKAKPVAFFSTQQNEIS
jgi:hypothetical protein